jgi:hypothetical protein
MSLLQKKDLTPFTSFECDLAVEKDEALNQVNSAGGKCERDVPEQGI